MGLQHVLASFFTISIWYLIGGSDTIAGLETTQSLHEIFRFYSHGSCVSGETRIGQSAHRTVYAGGIHVTAIGGSIGGSGTKYVASIDQPTMIGN